MTEAVVVSGDESLTDAIETAQTQRARTSTWPIWIGGIAPAQTLIWEQWVIWTADPRAAGRTPIRSSQHGESS